ncbi:MAG: hypothetical protein UFJ18_14995 [Blautia sp.]|nr:hypothetical protein [Blautia sp.]
MSKMTDFDIKKHIKNGVHEICPDKAEEIWSQPVTRASGDEWFLDGVKKPGRRPGKALWMVPPFAACAMVCFLFLHIWNFRTEATVYLDVNPSIELEINRKEKILSAQANNEDGEIVLENMNLKNTELDVAVNAILGSMVKNGYLNEAKSMILLSVDGTNQEKADRIREKLSEDMNSCLTSLLGSGAVFHQDIKADKEMKMLAEEYEISPGKAALLQKITKDHPKLSYDSLAKITMNQLPLYLEKQGVDIRDYTYYTGSKFPEKEEDEDKDDAADSDDRKEKEEKEEPDDDSDDDDERAKPEKETASSGSVNKPGTGGSFGGNARPEMGEIQDSANKPEQEEPSEDIEENSEDTPEQEEDSGEEAFDDDTESDDSDNESYDGQEAEESDGEEEEDD